VLQVQRDARPDGRGASPANLVTGLRIVLAGLAGVLAVLDAPPVALAVVLAGALLSDFVDGRVARATGTASRFGARLDLEADAFLILVLSTVVAMDHGAWVLGLGLVRYVFAVGVLLVPGLQHEPPPRPWCKVVAALVATVLAVVAVGPLPSAVETAALVVVALLLAESFAHEAVDRWRVGTRSPVRRPGSLALTVLAFVVVWLALVAPVDLDQVTWRALLQVPLEILVVVGLALLPWPRVRTAAALLVGLVIALLVVVKVLDLGFEAVFDRRFDPVGDWSYLGPGVGVLGDSIGAGWARATAVGAAFVALAVLVGVPLAVLRLTRVAAGRLRLSVPAAVAVALAWLLFFTTGVEALDGAPVASTSATSLTVDEVELVRSGLADHRQFAAEIDEDPYAAQPDDALLAGLHGKDVLVVFVESYGRVAVQDSSFAPGVVQVLQQGDRRLRAAGYSSRSAFLTSPTFGAGSWLAHASLQSGLWVDSQRRYRQLLTEDRMTLTGAFGRAGWHTVFDVPADTKDWPEGKEFYGFDTYYDSRNVDYQGPEFGYAPVPDQYTLADFHRRELAPTDRAPVMAEIDLISSHHPWTPLPVPVGWDEVGDGSVFDGMPEQGPTSQEVFSDPEAVKRVYGESIEYSLDTLTSFLATYPDPDLVVVMLGDHQPHSYVSGQDVGHDVPVTVISQDPEVLDRIAGWDWHDGLLPPPEAPVWRMDAFRDRFLDAFS
jgi:phosphatidylglycerophosphate synthase